MNRRIIAGYLVFCILFFAGLLAYMAIRLVVQRNRNYESAELALAEIARESSSFYLASRDFADPIFLAHMRRTVAARPRMLVATVYSRGEGLHYVSARSRSMAPSPEAPWAGAVEYGPLPFGTRVLSVPYAPAGGRDLAVEGVFAVVAGEDVFPVLKEAFILVFCFLLATVAVLVITNGERGPGRQQVPAAERSRPGREEPPRPSQGSVEQSPEMFSDVTGLCRRELLGHRLKSELERSASFDQDMILSIIAIDSFARLPSREKAYADIATVIRDSIQFQDLAFEFGPGRYAVIVPDLDIGQGIAAMERLQKAIPRARRLTVTVGLTSRNGRLLSGKTLHAEAQAALERAQAAGRGRIVAFRADPERYRDVVAAGGA